MDRLERGSICGSIGGDTFASRIKKRDCHLRQHSIASLSKRFEQECKNNLSRQQSVCSSIGGKSLSNDFTEEVISPIDYTEEKRFNTCFHSFRFIVVMMAGFSLGMMLLLRYNVTVAILNMVNQTAIYLHEHPNKTIDDFYAEGYEVTGGEFDWDNEIQHMIMSWYMIAYTLPQIPMTKLGLWMGFRWAIPSSLALCALSAILTPVMSYWGWQWLIGLRLLNGISAAAIMPMLLSVVETWMPYDQITLGLTFAQLLQTVVSAANPLVAGFLCSYHWKWAFYIPGFFTIGFCFIWFLLVTDHPDENFLVSAKEIALICACDRPSDDVKTDSKDSKQETKVDVCQEEEEPEVQPNWRHIFKTPCIYAYMIMWCFYCSPYSVFAFILPTYLRQFLKISVAENGLYCFFIQSGSLFSVLWPHPILRLFNEKFGFSGTTSRRLAYLIVCSAVGLSFFYVGTFHATQILALWINRAFHGSNDIVVTGNLMSNFAKANLSSVAFSIMNTVGNLSIVFFSTFCGYVLDVTGQSEQGWTYIFYSLAGSQLVVLFIFSTCIKNGPIDFGLDQKSSEKKCTDKNGKEKSKNCDKSGCVNGKN